MEFTYKNHQLDIKRYPTGGNHTLRAWSAADEHILKYIEEEGIELNHPVIYNDGFGFLSCFLEDFSPRVVITMESQEKAILENRKNNHIDNEIHFFTPLEKMDEKSNVVLIKIPKTLELFKLFLNQISQYTSKETTVICSFMTKHFSNQILEIASEFFEKTEQSRAWKKSRLLILKNKKEFKEKNIINKITYAENKIIQQYYGVFSAHRIDYATQFLMQHIQLQKEDKIVLDLASGNGILAKTLKEIKEDITLHLMDDSQLAIASSKLNIQGENVHFHCNNNLDEFEDEYFDYVISNPPFHFGHEIDISIPLGLFEAVKRCLKPNGHFQLVANQHLNYKTHLVKLFKEVNVVAENKKFVIYNCF